MGFDSLLFLYAFDFLLLDRVSEFGTLFTWMREPPAFAVFIAAIHNLKFEKGGQAIRISERI